MDTDEQKFNGDLECGSTSLRNTKEDRFHTIRPIWELFNAAAREIVDRMMVSRGE